MSGINTGLYDSRQTGVSTMSRRIYLLAITTYTAIFIGVAAFGASLSDSLVFTNKWLYLLFLIACVAVSIGGAVLAHSNDDATVSIVGGFICSAAMGVMVGPFVALYELGSVVQALGITAGVVILTGLIGALLPKDLSMWGAPLFGGLLGLILLSFAAPFLAMLGLDYQLTVTVLDYAGILLFSAIMVYDLNKAARLDRTHNNAIDVAVNVFLNFANIFIRVLSLMGNKK
ncbi:MAG: Bax inhibitor-1 family protein [Candidatus Saccharimonadaceae bacterium]